MHLNWVLVMWTLWHIYSKTLLCVQPGEQMSSSVLQEIQRCGLRCSEVDLPPGAPMHASHQRWPCPALRVRTETIPRHRSHRRENPRKSYEELIAASFQCGLGRVRHHCRTLHQKAVVQQTMLPPLDLERHLLQDCQQQQRHYLSRSRALTPDHSDLPVCILTVHHL